MWWPRLLHHHSEVAWDDYEKDYSDLPEEVLDRHRKTEAVREGERASEIKERGEREAVQEADDARKRARQERLAALRSGVLRSWTKLHKGETGALPGTSGTELAAA
jgi:hypothetical protein